MGRRKQEDLSEQIENLEEETTSEAEAVEEELAPDSEEAAEVVAEAEEEVKEEKPKRQRRSRKKPEAAEVKAEEVAEVEAVAEEPVQEAAPEKPKRQSRRGKKQADTPEAQIELATDAMRKSMEDMVSQWERIQQISGAVSAQLEKVSHIVKPSIQEFVDTQDMVRPQNPKSQFITRFATAASIIAVLFSVVSLSLSQSARQVALNAEATRVANSQLFPSHPTAAIQNNEVAALPVESRPAKRAHVEPFVGPKPLKAHSKFRK